MPKPPRPNATQRTLLPSSQVSTFALYFVASNSILMPSPLYSPRALSPRPYTHSPYLRVLPCEPQPRAQSNRYRTSARHGSSPTRVNVELQVSSPAPHFPPQSHDPQRRSACPDGTHISIRPRIAFLNVTIFPWTSPPLGLNIRVHLPRTLVSHVASISVERSAWIHFNTTILAHDVASIFAEAGRQKESRS